MDYFSKSIEDALSVPNNWSLLYLFILLGSKIKLQLPSHGNYMLDDQFMEDWASAHVLAYFPMERRVKLKSRSHHHLGSLVSQTKTTQFLFSTPLFHDPDRPRTREAPITICYPMCPFSIFVPLTMTLGFAQPTTTSMLVALSVKRDPIGWTFSQYFV